VNVDSYNNLTHQDSDAALYAIPSIMKALHKLGCKTEKLIVFIPPSRIPAGETVD